MARTTVDAVQLIVSTGALTDPQIQAFIDDASAWVDANLVEGCPDLSTAELTAIEKYLAAYFITVRQPLLTSKRRGDIQDVYQRGTTENEYLRLALSFDHCGIMAEQFLDQGGKSRVKFRAGRGFDPNRDLPRSST